MCVKVPLKDMLITLLVHLRRNYALSFFIKYSVIVWIGNFCIYFCVMPKLFIVAMLEDIALGHVFM